MAIGWIVGIVTSILTVASFIFGGIKWYVGVEEKNYGRSDDSKSNGKKMIKNGITFVLLGVVLLFTFILVPFSFHTVDTGEVAVVKHLGEAKEVKTPGLSYDFWMTNTYEYINTQTQELAIETMAYSSDAQVMTIQMTAQYQMRGDKAVDIVKQYGNAEALKSRITSIIIETPKSVVSKRTAMDIIANRGKITPEVEAAIIESIGEDYFVDITKVTITNIDFSDAFESAVEDKMIAEQTKLKADYENQTKIAQAEADAEAKLKAAQAEIEIAKANAEAKKIAAEAEAEANRAIQNSITDKILEKQYLEKWDGKLPGVVAGEDVSMILPGN